MSTDLVRRCDSCRREVPLGQPVYVLARVELAMVPDGRAVTIPSPRDACSEPCLLNMVRGLLREASLRPAPEPSTTCI